MSGGISLIPLTEPPLFAIFSVSSSLSRPLLDRSPKNIGLVCVSCLPPSTLCFVKATPKSGSHPDDALAIMLMVPVGATVVTVAFLIFGLPGASNTLPSKAGKGPRSAASSALF